MKTDNKPRIFLSYAREDEDAALILYHDLCKRGIKLWLDTEELLPGQNWKSEIRKAIKSSEFFITLLSNNSVSKRGYVQKELKLALDIFEEFPDNHVYFLPVRLNECQPSYTRLEELHWVDLFPSYDRGFKRLLKVLGVPEEDSWVDKDELLLERAFELLVAFIEEEQPDKIVDWASDELHRLAWKEITELYKWWKIDRPQRHDPLDDVSRDDPNYKAIVEMSIKLEEMWEQEDQINLHRLIDVRPHLWC
ncbi:MAG: toll/interleukin-1 receptor domain-containing protein [Pyrinomonadaceae bacterium]